MSHRPHHSLGRSVESPSLMMMPRTKNMAAPGGEPRERASGERRLLGSPAESSREENCMQWAAMGGSSLCMSAVRWLDNSASVIPPMRHQSGFVAVFGGSLRGREEYAEPSGNVVDFDTQVAPYDRLTPSWDRLCYEWHRDDGLGQASLRYTIASSSRYDFDPIAVRQAVYYFGCYAAIITDPNATALLRGVVTIGNSSDDPHQCDSVHPIVSQTRRLLL
ncbi:hypothetical protein DL765_004678 [Monosporascus sp. GIB2]|nr:hypothetical protein DL765_004678 [Monosporascus sp. GIB2]